jgi:hypothetical protein
MYLLKYSTLVCEVQYLLYSGTYTRKTASGSGQWVGLRAGDLARVFRATGGTLTIKTLDNVVVKDYKIATYCNLQT